MLLSQYRERTRWLLNDAQGNYWTNDELNSYINEAREKTATVTSCVRKFQTGTLLAGIDKYLFTTLLPTDGTRTVDILGIQPHFGNTRYSLRKYPYAYLTAFYRPWTNYRQLPVAFAKYGPNVIYVAPMPNVDYADTEFDTAVLPENLVNDNTVDQIPLNYPDAVKYYAARLAKIRQQQYEEALAFDKLFTQRVNELNAENDAFNVPNIYEQDF